METGHTGIKWSAVIWAAFLMFLIPMLVYLLVPTLYATYVGFSSRGDPAQINAAVQTIGTSMFYKILVYAVFASIALWRSYVLLKKVTTQRLLHIAIAVVIAALLVIVVFIALSQGAVGALVEAIIFSLLMAGGAFLGSLLKPSPAV